MDDTIEHVLIEIVWNVPSVDEELKRLSFRHKMNFKSISIKLTALVYIKFEKEDRLCLSEKL